MEQVLVLMYYTCQLNEKGGNYHRNITIGVWSNLFAQITSGLIAPRPTARSGKNVPRSSLMTHHVRN